MVVICKTCGNRTAIPYPGVKTWCDCGEMVQDSCISGPATPCPFCGVSVQKTGLYGRLAFACTCGWSGPLEPAMPQPVQGDDPQFGVGISFQHWMAIVTPLWEGTIESLVIHAGRPGGWPTSAEAVDLLERFAGDLTGTRNPGRFRLFDLLADARNQTTEAGRIRATIAAAKTAGMQLLQYEQKERGMCYRDTAIRRAIDRADRKGYPLWDDGSIGADLEPREHFKGLQKAAADGSEGRQRILLSWSIRMLVGECPLPFPVRWGALSNLTPIPA